LTANAGTDNNHIVSVSGKHVESVEDQYIVYGIRHTLSGTEYVHFVLFKPGSDSGGIELLLTRLTITDTVSQVF